jgi:surface polysaccharide O-acyltransferase-like enzyme
MNTALRGSSDRLIWADACRVIAIFAVILIHTAAPVVDAYLTIPLDYFLAANLFDSLSRVAVPLFAMLSGALLIGYSPDIQLQRMRKRQVRVIVPLVFWSFIYLGRSFWREKPFPLFEALGLMLKAPVMYHLWFIYMIIGIYLLLPLLSVISEALLQNQRLAVYTFALWFLINSVPIYYPTSLLGWLTLTGFLSWAGLFIIGYYVTHAAVLNRIPARLCAIVFVFASLCTFFLNWRINSQSSVPNETAYNSLSPNVVLAAIAAFLWIQKLQIPKCLYKPLAFMSSLTFPIYFMHLLVIVMLKSGWLGFSISPYSFHPSLSILVLAIATFLISLTIAAITRLIPHSEKIFG